MKSYLSSFGANPTPAESERHEVFKRSSTSRKTKKTKSKKVPTTTTTEPTPIEEIPTKPLAGANNGKNFTVSPRHIVKFELDDAKYSEEYEKLRQSRKLKVRAKRSTDGEKKTNGTRTERFITKETFVQPKEFFKFSYLDAVTSPPEASEMNESEKKIKREVQPTDSTATDTKVHVSNAMRGYRSTKHVSYDDISPKLQKMIESAIGDAIARGKASDGDYLKFFYGDKIIKVPVSMSKYISSVKAKESAAKVKTETTVTYGTKLVSFPQEDSKSPKETTTTYSSKFVSYPQEDSKPQKETTVIYGSKLASFPQEEYKPEAPQLLGTKNAYFPLKNSGIKYESKPSFLPTISTSTDKAESYVNFESPILVQPDAQENKNYLPYQKSIYYYSGDNSYPSKNSVSSPGPVLFDEVPTTPSSIGSSKTHHFKNFIYHPPTKAAVKDHVPIVESVDEGFSYIPLVPQKHHAPIFRPTSYVEYAGNHADHSENDKNYEFG